MLQVRVIKINGHGPCPSGTGILVGQRAAYISIMRSESRCCERGSESAVRLQRARLLPDSSGKCLCTSWHLRGGQQHSVQKITKKASEMKSAESSKNEIMTSLRFCFSLIPLPLVVATVNHEVFSDRNFSELSILPAPSHPRNKKRADHRL